MADYTACVEAKLFGKYASCRHSISSNCKAPTEAPLLISGRDLSCQDLSCLGALCRHLHNIVHYTIFNPLWPIYIQEFISRNLMLG